MCPHNMHVATYGTYMSPHNKCPICGLVIDVPDVLVRVLAYVL